MTRVLVALFVALVLVDAPGPASVSGQAWLANGDLENGAAGWFVSQGAAPDCEPLGGNGAVGVGVVDGVDPRLIHELAGSFPAADYTLNGWVRVQTGTATVRLEVDLIRPGGLGSEKSEVMLPAGPEYALFELVSTAAFTPEAIRIVFHVHSEDAAEVCFDNLRLTTPDPPPTATASLPPSSPTATSSTPGATATSQAPSETPSPPAPSATTAPTATPAPSFAFANGGFEEGLVGWSKFGGKLTTTSNAYTGALAGQLVSSSDSTKWAYQSVAISPGAFYELSAYLQPGAATDYGLLRISWYPTSDASGAASSTSDSIAVASGGGYSSLTTGPIQAPPGTASARVRILLVPSGASYATLTIDEVWFGTVAAPTATPSASPTPSTTPSPTSTAVPSATIHPAASPATATSSEPGANRPASPLTSGAVADTVGTASPTTQAEISDPVPSAEVDAVTYVPPDATPFGAVSGASKELTGPAAGRFPWAWLFGISLVLVGFTGVILQRLGLIR